MMSAKKNVTLRAAAVLFALALITSCFVGGTFAKYVTNGTGSDKARVAKFGVTVEANGTMFAEKYDAEKEAKTVASSRVGVAEGDKDNVVAPGTSGKMVSMKLTGTPEVKVHVNYAPTVTLSDNWTLEDGTFYCPLQITIGTATIDGLKYNAKAAFVAAIENEIVSNISNNKTYDAGTDLSTVGNDALAISWAWPFETRDEAGKSNDAKDTHLGDQAANNNAATIEISVVTTVTQVD